MEAAPETEPEAAENPLETEAEIAADYLEELLDIADLDGDIDTYIEGDRAHVSIVSESQVLVGAKGEVLDALQELTRLAVMTETGDRSRLMLDRSEEHTSELQSRQYIVCRLLLEKYIKQVKPLTYAGAALQYVAVLRRK